MRALAARNVRLGVVTVLAASAALALLLAHVLGLHLVVAPAEEVSPSSSPGDLLVSTRAVVDTLRAGEVITFSDPARDMDVTHRVVSVAAASPDEYVLTTRGGAGTTPVRWHLPAGSTVSRQEAVVPRAGTLATAVVGGPLWTAVIGVGVLTAGVVLVRRLSARD